MPDQPQPWEEDDEFTDSLPYVNAPYTAIRDERNLTDLAE